MVKHILSSDEKTMIMRAVQDAEEKTSCEIVPAIVPQSSMYVFTALRIGCLAAPVITGAVYFLRVLNNFYDLLFLQLLLMLTIALILKIFNWSRFFTSKKTRRNYVRRYARKLFDQHQLGNTRQYNGLLLFISTQEKCVELLVDTGISAVVPDIAWQQIVDALSDAIAEDKFALGLVQAVEKCGALLMSYFPVSQDVDNLNELSNEVIG